MATILGVDGITFDQLWDIDVDSVQERCFHEYKVKGDPNSGKVKWKDYCAIKMSERLIKAGFLMPSKKTSPYRQCHSHPGDGQNSYHFLLAEEMANWLLKKPIAGIPDVQKATGDNFEDIFSSKKGIIFLKDFWKRDGEAYESRSGDHIDLWYKGRLTSSSNFWREISEAFGVVSSLEDSRSVWLWELP